MGKKPAIKCRRMRWSKTGGKQRNQNQLPRAVHKRDYQTNYIKEGNWEGINCESRILQVTIIMFGYLWGMRVVVLLYSGRSALWLCMVSQHLPCTKQWWKAIGEMWSALTVYSATACVIKPLGWFELAWFGKEWNKKIDASKNNISKVGNRCGNTRRHLNGRKLRGRENRPSRLNCSSENGWIRRIM